MKKLVGLLALVLLLGLAVIAAYFATGHTLKMSIPRQELEASAQKVFPINHGIIKFDMTGVKVGCLPADNRVTISGDINIAVLGLINAAGNCRVSGTPQYHAATQTIRFQDIRIEQLTISGMTEKMHAQIMQLADKAVATFLGEYPFYQFNQEKRLQKFIGAHVRGVTVGEDALTLTVGW
ncbi:MAG: DUF1439 domain-containing protein [Verrucomicrobiales bacterium]|jgi:hypothetical protein|nr:DUF1439 domain-containing protein [Verrucomicrobiales bacterium]